MTDAIRIYDLKQGGFCERPLCELVLALGNFDGVHLAHSTLFARAVQIARDRTVAPTAGAAFCFDPPSSCYLGMSDGCLSTREEKLMLLKQNGLDYALLADFSRLRSLSAEAFVREVLAGECRTVHAVCGFHYRFGKGGSGTADTLCDLLGKDAVSIIPPMSLTLDGQDVLISSTAIRTALSRGDVDTAAHLLGRPYSLTAPVVHGKQLGRTLGLPTINQNVPTDKLIPRNGIYVSRICLQGEPRYGVTNVGHRPTVDGAHASINCETHILDLDRDLYGETVTVEFLHRLRDERQFASVEALKAAIEQDIASARAYLEH